MAHASVANKYRASSLQYAIDEDSMMPNSNVPRLVAMVCR